MRGVFALVYVLLFMYSIFGIIASLVEEKETRARELIRMMSVRNPAIVASWYLTYGIIFLILNALVVGISGCPFGPGLFTTVRFMMMTSLVPP